MKTMQKIVIKLGTSSLTQGTQTLARHYMLGLVQQILQLQQRGLQLILVSSGAVALGRKCLSSSQSAPSKQALASIGQVKLMQAWSELFSLFDTEIAQLLLIKEDFSESRQQFTLDTLSCLLEHRIIPIINENDPVATHETRIGDNDNLSALVAKLVGADTVILLTDQEGLYTADPRRHPNAKLISCVTEIDDRVLALAGGSSTSLGTGGMATKLQAAQLAAKSGTRTIIAPACRPNVLLDLAAGKEIGTLCLGATQS